MSGQSLNDKTPHWSAWVTYWLYIVLCFVWYSAVLGTCTYLVFWLNHSGWWYLLALFFCGNLIRPTEWVYGIPKPKDDDDE